MKKLFLLLVAIITVGIAKAETYSVTIESLVEYRYIDNRTGEEVASGTERPSIHQYTIDARTPDMARNDAYKKCASACNSSWTIETSNVDINGKNCRKVVRQIPNRSSVEVK